MCGATSVLEQLEVYMSLQTLSLDIVSPGAKTEKRPSRESIEIFFCSLEKKNRQSSLFMLNKLSFCSCGLFAFQEHGGSHEGAVNQRRFQDHCGVPH